MMLTSILLSFKVSSSRYLSCIPTLHRHPSLMCFPALWVVDFTFIHALIIKGQFGDNQDGPIYTCNLSREEPIDLPPANLGNGTIGGNKVKREERKRLLNQCSSDNESHSHLQREVYLCLERLTCHRRNIQAVWFVLLMPKSQRENALGFLEQISLGLL